MTPTHDIQHRQGVLRALRDFHHGYRRLRSRRRPESRRSPDPPRPSQTSGRAEIDDVGPLFGGLPVT